MRRRYSCLTSFFPIVDTCLSCKDTARQSCVMVQRWQFFVSLLHPVFPASRVSTFQTCILNSHWCHTMCRSMADIHSASDEIRWRKKERRKKQETTKQKYNVRICYAGRPWQKHTFTNQNECTTTQNKCKLEMWTNNVMAALTNISGTLCSTLQSLADVRYCCMFYVWISYILYFVYDIHNK